MSKEASLTVLKAGVQRLMDNGREIIPELCNRETDCMVAMLFLLEMRLWKDLLLEGAQRCKKGSNSAKYWEAVPVIIWQQRDVLYSAFWSVREECVLSVGCRCRLWLCSVLGAGADSDCVQCWVQVQTLTVFSVGCRCRLWLCSVLGAGADSVFRTVSDFGISFPQRSMHLVCFVQVETTLRCCWWALQVECCVQVYIYLWWWWCLFQVHHLQGPGDARRLYPFTFCSQSWCEM